MEKELERFRKHKKSEQRKQELKEKISTYWTRFQQKLMSYLLPDKDEITQPNEGERENNETTSVNRKTSYTKVDYLILSLQIIAWFVLYIGFLKIEFGAVYFCTSLLFIIYWNTGTSKKRKGEVSAYSVFNKDFEAIQGTLKSEHLENQLIYRNK